MSTTTIAVIGANYGGEGKGLYVSYFADQLKSGYVVRYNSGSQASHTVTIDENKRHIFRHLGSGTFCNFPTIWAHRCVANPTQYKLEFLELMEKDITPKLFVHRDCFVTTPYDIITNQIIETKRNELRHSSSGTGFSETIVRNTKLSGHILLVKDLYTNTDVLIDKLESIRKYYLEWRMQQEFPGITMSEIKKLATKFHYYDQDLLDGYVEDCQFFTQNIQLIKNYSILNNQNIIFEGAHGLLLDQEFGEFPYVTHSNTGLRNIMEIVDTLNTITSMSVIYVSRTYTFRQGKGSMVNEFSYPDALLKADKTNIVNEFQGAPRYAPLNVVKMYNAIKYDLTYAYHASFPIKNQLAFTWGDYPQEMLYNTKLLGVTKNDFTEWVKAVGAYVSYGPKISDVEKNSKLK